jgi:hypothetical protein
VYPFGDARLPLAYVVCDDRPPRGWRCRADERYRGSVGVFPKMWRQGVTSNFPAYVNDPVYPDYPRDTRLGFSDTIRQIGGDPYCSLFLGGEIR